MRYTSSLSDVADVTIEAIAVELSDEEFPLVTARYALEANLSGDRRPILIDYSECPLWPIAVEGNGVESVVYGADSNAPVDYTLLRLESGRDWRSSSEIIVKLRWTTPASHPPLIDENYLFVPANLPRIGRVRPTQTGTFVQVPVRMHKGDERLVGAIAHSLSDVATENRPLVQGVVGRYAGLRCGEAEERAQVRLIGVANSELSEIHQQQICSKLREMYDFFSEHLKARPASRIAAALHATSETKGTSGTLLTRPLANFKLRGLHEPPHEFPIARDISSIWWETGCRIEGADGFHLSAGISFALGLAWTKSHTSSQRFQELLQWYRQRIVPAGRFAPVKFRPGERLVVRGMVLYEALEQTPSLWKVLQDLTNDYWGANAPKEIVVAMLEQGGVPTKDFTGKRFLHD